MFSSSYSHHENKNDSMCSLDSDGSSFFIPDEKVKAAFGDKDLETSNDESSTEKCSEHLKAESASDLSSEFMAGQFSRPISTADKLERIAKCAGNICEDSICLQVCVFA